MLRVVLCAGCSQVFGNSRPRKRTAWQCLQTPEAQLRRGMIYRESHPMDARQCDTEHLRSPLDTRRSDRRMWLAVAAVALALVVALAMAVYPQRCRSFVGTLGSVLLAR